MGGPDAPAVTARLGRNLIEGGEQAGHRNEGHWLTDEELEDLTHGQRIEAAVIEIRNLMSVLESAFSVVEDMAVVVRAKELGFDRHTSFWPATPGGANFGMVWVDREEEIEGLDSPADLEPGWKPDPRYGDRLRYWWGYEWDALVAPAPGNLDSYLMMAAGKEVAFVTANAHYIGTLSCVVQRSKGETFVSETDQSSSLDSLAS